MARRFRQIPQETAAEMHGGSLASARATWFRVDLCDLSVSEYS